MRINKRHLLENICAKPADDRGTLRAPWLDKEAGVIVASNGRAMVTIKADEIGEEETSGAVSIEALKASRKAFNLVSCNGACVVPGANGDTAFPREDLGKYPAYAQVMAGYRPDEAPVRVTVDPWLLLELAKAMGVKKNDGGVTLHLDPVATSATVRDGKTVRDEKGTQMDAIPVTCSNHEAAGMQAVLMPMRSA